MEWKIVNIGAACTSLTGNTSNIGSFSTVIVVNNQRTPTPELHRRLRYISRPFPKMGNISFRFCECNASTSSSPYPLYLYTTIGLPFPSMLSEVRANAGHALSIDHL